MKKNNKNFKWKSFISGIFVSMILGVFCYFILTFVWNENNKKTIIKNPNSDILSQLEYKNWKGILIPIFDEKKMKTDDSISKKNYKEKKLLNSIPIRMYLSPDSQEYVMNDSQFQDFVNMLEEKLPYGPEIYGLNMININKNRGNYFNPIYKFINLEIGAFYKSSDKLLDSDDQPNEKYISFYDEHIQIATHEYLHYLDEIYSRSYIVEDSKKLYDLGGGTMVQNNHIPKPKIFYVNKKFIENFKQILNYDNEKLLNHWNSSAVSINRNKPEHFITIKHKIPLISVANKYPVKWMWDRVNETPKVDLQIPKGEENIVIGSKKYFDLVQYSNYLHSIWSKRQYYSYQYSELFARRFASLLYKEEKDKIDKQTSIWTKSYISVNGVRRFDTTTSKYNFKFSRISPAIYNPSSNDPYVKNNLRVQDIWFDDYPYDWMEIPNSSNPNYNTYRSTKLYNLLRKIMGQYNGSDISWITRNNKFKYRNWDNFKDQKKILSYINGIWSLVKEKKSQNPSLEIPEWVQNSLNNFRFESTSKNNDFLLRIGGYLSAEDINNLGLSLSSFNQKKGLEIGIGLLNDDNTVTSLNKKAIIHKYNVKKVSSFIENEYIDFEPLDDNYFWVINNLDDQNIVKDLNNNFLEDFDYKNDFIDLTKIENKKLVLLNKNDLTKFIPLKTARYENKDELNEFGKATTVINKTLLQKDDKYAYAIEENNFAKIKKRKTKFI